MLKPIMLASVAVFSLPLLATGVAAQSTTGGAPQGAAASADPIFADIIVRARRVDENLQRVPATVTAIAAEQLMRENIGAVKDLPKLSPSLAVASYFNDLNARFAVRGLADGVTTYFAEAPCCGGVASAPFMDIASVQVLNGPQGTLFGRSSTAGAVLIYPEKPELDRFGGLVDATVGTHGRFQFTGVLNVPVVSEHLALRLAVNSNHVDGYTRQFGTSSRLDDVNNRQYRLGVRLAAGGFENTLFISHVNVDQAATSMVLAAYNPNYHFPSTVFSDAFQQEMDRLRAGGDSASRITHPPYDGQAQYTKLKQTSIVNTTQYDFHDSGDHKIDIKNIVSFESFTSNVAAAYDGIGGIAEEGAFASAIYSNIGSNNQVGTRLMARMGPPLHTWTEELQLHGSFWDGLISANVGGFYLNRKAPKNPDGTANIYKLFSNPAGYTNAAGFIESATQKEKALFAQTTVDLSKAGVHGLSVTAGYRYSWSDSELVSAAPVKDPLTGTFHPGSTTTGGKTSSKGYNYTFSVQEQFTPDIMAYVTASRAYVPGGVNTITSEGIDQLPNYSPIYGSATVETQEIGVKTQFSLGNVGVRLNGSLFTNKFSNIAQQLNGVIGDTVVRYQANIAAAKLRGAELAGAIAFSRAFEVSFGYSYNDAKYTEWTGTDPFNVAKVGDAICVPDSPAGLCYLDLSNNPFPYMADHQGFVTVAYTAPMSDIGELGLSATVSGKSRVYYQAAAARDLQLYPDGLNGVSQAPYATLDLRAELRNVRDSGWNAALFATNVTDKLYATGKVAQLQTLGFSAANYAPPRMLGLQVWKKF